MWPVRPGGEVVAGGLSMPHSPRCHAGRLWLLESGNGGVGFVESSGRLETVARLPGFTRGLDFHGRFAFIGLSQVRESAVFSGIAVSNASVSALSGPLASQPTNGAEVMQGA